MFGPSMGMWGLVRLFNGVPPRVHLLGLACMRPRKAPPSMGPTLGLGPLPPARAAQNRKPRPHLGGTPNATKNFLLGMSMFWAHPEKRRERNSNLC